MHPNGYVKRKLKSVHPACGWSSPASGGILVIEQPQYFPLVKNTNGKLGCHSEALAEESHICNIMDLLDSSPAKGGVRMTEETCLVIF